MRFSTTLLATGLATLAQAQVYFTSATIPSQISPSMPLSLSWLNGAGSSTVSLILVQGPATDLKTVMTIASGLSHNGSYSFTPSSSLTSSSNYAVKIQDDSSPSTNYNYCQQFAIVGTAVTGSVTGVGSTVSTVAPTSSVAASTTAPVTVLTGTNSVTSAAMTTSGTATSAGSTTSTRSAATTTASTPGVNSGAMNIKVGGGVLALIAAAMMAM